MKVASASSIIILLLLSAVFINSLLVQNSAVQSASQNFTSPFAGPLLAYRDGLTVELQDIQDVISVAPQYMQNPNTLAQLQTMAQGIQSAINAADKATADEGYPATPTFDRTTYTYAARYTALLAMHWFHAAHEMTYTVEHTSTNDPVLPPTNIDFSGPNLVDRISTQAAPIVNGWWNQWATNYGFNLVGTPIQGGSNHGATTASFCRDLQQLQNGISDLGTNELQGALKHYTVTADTSLQLNTLVPNGVGTAQTALNAAFADESGTQCDSLPDTPAPNSAVDVIGRISFRWYDEAFEMLNSPIFGVEAQFNANQSPPPPDSVFTVDAPYTSSTIGCFPEATGHIYNFDQFTTVEGSTVNCQPPQNTPTILQNWMASVNIGSCQQPPCLITTTTSSSPTTSSSTSSSSSSTTSGPTTTSSTSNTISSSSTAGSTTSRTTTSSSTTSHSSVSTTTTVSTTTSSSSSTTTSSSSTAASSTSSSSSPPPLQASLSISLLQNYGSTIQGGSIAASVQTSIQRGSGQPIVLGYGSSAPGFTISFYPSQGYPSFSSSMQIEVPQSMAPGLYPIQVTASAQGLLQSTTFYLEVTAVLTHFVLQISASPAAAGVTDPSPGSHWYLIGSSVTAAAIPNSNWAFDHWEENGAMASTAQIFTFGLVQNNTILTAVFSYQPTSIQTVSATFLNQGYGAAKIGVDGRNYSLPASLTWVVGSSHTVTAYSTDLTTSHEDFLGWSFSTKATTSPVLHLVANSSLFIFANYREQTLTRVSFTDSQGRPLSLQDASILGPSGIFTVRSDQKFWMTTGAHYSLVSAKVMGVDVAPTGATAYVVTGGPSGILVLNLPVYDESITVLDIFGLPLWGAHVTLYDQAGQNESAVTDGNGVATFSDVPFGTYTANVRYLGASYGINQPSVGTHPITTVIALSYPLIAVFAVIGALGSFMVFRKLRSRNVQEDWFGYEPL